MKNKILLKSLTAISTIGVLAPMTFLSVSCNKGTKNIEIKHNDNIEVTIEATEIKVGEDLVISFKLKDNYSLDFTNSKITFPESNFDVKLSQCFIDCENLKITVPASLVTFNRVVVDIKASASLVDLITKDNYNAAIYYLTTAEERNYQLEGSVVPPEKPELNTKKYAFYANSRNDEYIATSYKKDASGEIVEVQDKSFGKAEKDASANIYPGYTSIYHDGSKYIGVPSVTTIERKQIKDFVNDYIPSYRDVTKNTILDTFVYENEQTGEIKYVKFNESRKITNLVGNIYTTSLCAYSFSVKYEDTPINFVDFTKKEECFCEYDTTNWELAVRNYQTKAVKQCKHVLFKFDLELRYSWDKTKPIFIKFDNGSQFPTAPADIAVYFNGVKATSGGNPGQFIAQDGQLKIIGGTFTGFTHDYVSICIGSSPIIDESTPTTSLITVYQPD